MRGRTTAVARSVAGLVVACLCLVTAATSTSAGSGTGSGASDRAGSGSPQVGGSSAAVGRRPNILLLMTDDQSVTDLSVMRHVLRRLGARGTTFTHGFSPYPLCCPARASTLTGQYAHNHHVLGNRPPWGGFQAFDDQNTLPMWLQQAGYHTALLGKYLNGYPDPADPLYIPPGWDSWRVPVNGIYNYRHWQMNEDGVLVDHRGQYQTNYVGAEASDLIAKYAPATEPFFLWANFLAPHRGGPVEPDDPIVQWGPPAIGTPAVALPHRDDMAGVPLPAKASINEADVSDKPDYIESSPLLRRAALRELNQQRLESLLSVDSAVDRILDALQASGELANTVIIFTSDNGYLIGEHRRIGKIIGYEESTRVPFLVAGPGFNTGQRRDQLVSLVDIAATVAGLARTPARLVQDGQSLLPIARNPSVASDRPILLQAGPQRRQPERWYTGIRTQRFVYVEYDTGERELYDLDADPLQLVNLADQPASADTQQTLARALAVLRACAGQTCRDTVAKLSAAAASQAGGQPERGTDGP